MEGGFVMNEDANSFMGWHNLPKDVMSNVVKRLNLTHRLRMSLVCKSWKAIVMQDDILPGHDAPWLLLPQPQNSPDLTFYSLSEGRILSLQMPLPALGGWCCGSSKGWLAFVNGPKYCPEFYLVNPLSGELVELPPLALLPCFQTFMNNLPQQHNVSSFVQQVEVSNDGSSSGFLVAAIFSSFKVLAICSPQDEKWTVYRAGSEDCFYEDVLFYHGDLYTIMTGKTGTIQFEQTISFDDREVTLEVLLPPYEAMDAAQDEAKYENNPGFLIAKKMVAKLYLIDSYKGELFMVVKYNDVFIMNNHNEVNEDLYYESPLRYFRTSEFAVLNINPENGQWGFAKG